MKILFFATLILALSACSKPVVQTRDDAPKLELGKKRYTHKSLAKVIKQIVPEIQSVTSIDGEYPTVIGAFYLSFQNAKDAHLLSIHNNAPTTIAVYINNSFKLDTTQFKQSKLTWNEFLIQNYGKLKVNDIIVYGKN